MASNILTDTPTTHHRTWIVPTVLVAAHTLFNVLADPFQMNNYSWTFMLAGGVFYIQPVLFAVWAAIGPPPVVKRIALTLAAYAAVLVGSASVLSLRQGEPENPALLVIMTALFVATFVALLIVSKFTRWRIDIPAPIRDAAESGSQFSLKFLFIFTTICAVLLAAGRGLSWVEDTGAFEFARFCTMIGIVLMLLFPAFIIPLTALSAQLTNRALIIVPILCLIFTALAVVATLRFEPGADREMIGFVLLVQLGALIGGLLSALFLRFNGYRLIRRSATSSASPTPSH
jgi:hypothetical protein